MGNGLSKLFNLRGRTIDLSEQSAFTINDSFLRDKEVNKINKIDPLAATQRRSGHFLPFMITAHPDQASPNCKHSRMNCRACVQLPIYVNGIDASIDTQILKNYLFFLFHLVAFYDRIN